MTSLPPWTDRKYLSASAMNQLSISLLSCYDWACQASPFDSSDKFDNGTETYYILHTSDSFRYNYNQIAGRGVTGTVTLKLNGTTIGTPTTTAGVKSGIIDISGLGLTVGTVYPVTITLASGYRVQAHWLGETKVINYTTPPTFTPGVTVTAADLEALRTCITEIESAMDWPLPPCATNHVYDYCEGSNDYLFVMGFDFFHRGHDLLHYKYWHHSKDWKVSTKIFLNGTNLVTHTEKTAGHWHDTTVDISTLSLVNGTIYHGYVTVELAGTSNSTKVENRCQRITVETATGCLPPPIWVHGDTPIAAADLTKYVTIIDAIHPGAAAPAYPLYYDQPAIRKNHATEFYLQHHRRWLRYRRKSSGGTATVNYGPELKTGVDMPSAVDTNQSYDLGQLPGLVQGQWYKVDGVDYCQEWTSNQP